MARISMQLLRFRSSSIVNQDLELIHPKTHIFLSRYPSSSSSSSSSLDEGRTFSIYHSSLKLLRGSTCQSIAQLHQIHAHLIASGIYYNPYWSSRVLKHSLDFLDFGYTNSIFGSIDSPNTFCVNTLVEAYLTSSCLPQLSVGFFFDMLKTDFSPNSFTFVPLFGCCAKVGCVELGQKLHGQAVKHGVDWVLHVQNSLIHMYGQCGVVGHARKMFDLMPLRDLVSWNSILSGYARVGDLNAADELFDVMPNRNVVSWNVMINGYINGGRPEDGLSLFWRMIEIGLRMNDTTMVCVVTACGRLGRLKFGRCLHGYFFRAFLKSSIVISTALIDMYSKCGKVETALKVFGLTSDRNLSCWNAMISGLCIHGNPENGLKLYAEMVDTYHHPDEVTFIGVLCACARLRKLTDGKNHFCSMISVYGLKPSFAHYWCLANLHVSVGLDEEAEAILRNMPDEVEDVTSETILWANLLASCRFEASSVELGERIAKSLIDREPSNFQYYRLLLNIYAAAGRWDDVTAVKGLIEERRMRRMPGSRLVDLNEIVHSLKL